MSKIGCFDIKNMVLEIEICKQKVIKFSRFNIDFYHNNFTSNSYLANFEMQIETNFE
jgi:hypothetical protein